MDTAYLMMFTLVVMTQPTPWASWTSPVKLEWCSVSTVHMGTACLVMFTLVVMTLISSVQTAGQGSCVDSA